MIRIGIAFGLGLGLGFIEFIRKFGHLYSPDENVHVVCCMIFYFILFFGRDFEILISRKFDFNKFKLEL